MPDCKGGKGRKHIGQSSFCGGCLKSSSWRILLFLENIKSNLRSIITDANRGNNDNANPIIAIYWIHMTTFDGKLNVMPIPNPNRGVNINVERMIITIFMYASSRWINVYNIIKPITTFLNDIVILMLVYKTGIGVL